MGRDNLGTRFQQVVLQKQIEEPKEKIEKTVVHIRAEQDLSRWDQIMH